MSRICAPNNLPCIAQDFAHFIIYTHGAGILLAVLITTATVAIYATVRE